MSFSNSVLFTVLPFFVIVGLYLFVKKKFEFFKKNGTLHMKPNSWLLGNLGEVTTKIHIVDFFRQTYETFKGKDVIAGYYSMFTPTILVLDLETIKNITIKDFNYFSHRGVYVNEEEDPISGHLFSLDGEKWKFLRNKLSPVFTSGKVKMMYHTISDKGAGLVKAIEKASTTGSVEMKEMANRFMIDAISSCAFGIESNTLGKEHPEFVALFKDIYGADGLSMFKNLFLFAFPTFSKFLNLRMFPKKIEDFFFENVGGTMKYREKNGVVRNDFLNMLLQLKNKGSIEGEFSTDSRKLSYNECVAQSFIFFFAGADTSSTVIAYAMVELGHHPEIQEKLRKEIFEKTKDSKDQITYDNLQEMTYLNQVVNETLRKFPPASFTFRKATKDYKIPGSMHTIKKDTQVMIPNIAIHYDENYWKHPGEFDPERFSADETSKRPNLAYMPFGEGPRNCIGMRFALVNVKFAVAIIVKNFRIELDESKTVLPLKFDPKAITIEPVGGFHVKFEKL